MDLHFSKETLRKNARELASRPTTSRSVDAAGRAIHAEERFEIDHTVQRMAYLAHLVREPTN